jgi:hypothetical protein
MRFSSYEMETPEGFEPSKSLLSESSALSFKLRGHEIYLDGECQRLFSTRTGLKKTVASHIRHHAFPQVIAGSPNVAVTAWFQHHMTGNANSRLRADVATRNMIPRSHLVKAFSTILLIVW